jgi:hypothetical protein
VAVELGLQISAGPMDFKGFCTQIRNQSKPKKFSDSNRISTSIKAETRR